MGRRLNLNVVVAKRAAIPSPLASNILALDHGHGVANRAQRLNVLLAIVGGSGGVGRVASRVIGPPAARAPPSRAPLPPLSEALNALSSSLSVAVSFMLRAPGDLPGDPPGDPPGAHPGTFRADPVRPSGAHPEPFGPISYSKITAKPQTRWALL